MKSIPKLGFRETLKVGKMIETDYVAAMREITARYGDCAMIEFLGSRIVFLFHPDAVEHVLKTNARNYLKGDALLEMVPVMGKGLVTSDGDHWREHRRLIAPEFHQNRVELYFAVMSRYLAPALRAWRQAGSLDMAREIAKLTYEIAGECFFGADVRESADIVYEAIELASESAMYRMSRRVKLPRWMPVRKYRRARTAIDRLDRVVYQIIDARLSGGDHSSPDLLTRLTRLKKDGNALSRKDIRDEVMTVLLAGHETTANSVAWTLYLLARNPKVQDDVRAEVQAKVADELPTIEELKGLPLLGRVLDEAMRLYPPVSMMSRKAIAADTIDGYPVPPRTNLTLSQYITHRHPDFWPEPERFDPARFEKAASAGRHPFAYFPFGGGPRECVGRNMALLESLLLVGALVRNFRLELATPEPIGLRPLITLRPHPGVPLRLTPAS